METYLLVLFLTVGLCGAFRVLSRDSFDLGQMPDSISYLGPHLLVVQTGSNISVYDTQTHKIVQKYQSDQESPDVQVAPQSNMILFLNNNSIFQIRQTNTPTIKYFNTSWFNWVYELGISGNAIMVHEISLDGNKHTLFYFYTDSGSSSVHMQIDSNYDRVVAGSRVVALSKEEYYFASGGVCSNKTGKALFYFYRGSSSTLMEKIYDLKVPGCQDSIFLPNTKQEWLLSTIDTGKSNRLHAITYLLNKRTQPRVFTTQVLTSSTSSIFFISQLARFDTKRLIGVDFLNGNLYTADDLLCRVVEHFPEYYNAAVPSESVLNFDITSSVVSQDESMVLVLTGTETYLLSVQDNIYSIDHNLTSPSGQVMNQAFFSNSTLLILLDSAQNLWIYNTEDQQWYQSGQMGVEDFCVTSSNLIFSVTHPNTNYLLTVSRVVSNGISLDIETINTSTLNQTFQDVMCLDSNSVLVNPINPGESIAIWKYSNAFVNTANLKKLAEKHSLAHTTSTAIFFTNSDNRSTPLFYDFTLSPIVLKNGLLLPPMATYSLVNTGSEQILLGVGDGSSSPVSIDHYQFFSDTLIYMGSYPLIFNGTAALSKVIVLPNSDKIFIEYVSSSNSRTITFNMASPPQQLRGHFYDASTLDCSGYTNGLFRINPSNNSLQLFVINRVPEIPALERYSFSKQANTLTLQRQAILKNFISSANLTAKLSQNQQNVLIYAYQIFGSDSFQVWNANNLDLTVDAQSSNTWQTYDLIGKDIYSTYVNQLNNYTYFKINHISSEKISTGVSGDVAFFATCGSCNFLAVVGTGNLFQILLVIIQSDLLPSTISTPCQVIMMTLGYDGLKLAYLCSNTSLFTYDTATGMHILQDSTYTNITSMRLLSANYLILVSNGIVSNIPLITSFMEDNLVAKGGERILMKVQASASPVLAISNSMGIYAFKASPQIVQINSFNGSSVQNFSLSSEEEIKGLAFSPDNNLTITTSKAELITLTSKPCFPHSTEQAGNCVCDATFIQGDLRCYCSSSLTIINGKCTCDTSQYFVSQTECQDCSSMCHTCSGEGFLNCDSFSAIFVVLIVLMVLLVAGLGILIYRKIKRSSKKDNTQSVTQTPSKEQSSDLLIQEPLMKVKEYN